MTLSRNLGGFGSTANVSGLVATSSLTGTISASQLAATAVTPGTYGGDNVNHRITVDQQGRITSAANVAMPQLENKIFTALRSTGSISGTTLTLSSPNQAWVGMNNVGPASTGAATISTSGTTMTVSAMTAGILGVGGVVTVTASFSGTYTSSGTTLTTVSSTTGALKVGDVLSLTASGITASKGTTTLTVTAITNGAISIGSSISGMTGTVTAFGTGTGGVGTYTMSTSQTVASAGGRTSSGGNATITALGTGNGGVGTYTIDRTLNSGASAATFTSSNAGTVTRTVAALGTGTGYTGTYTLNSAFDVPASSAISFTNAVTFTVTAINGDATSCTVTPSQAGIVTGISQTYQGTTGTWTSPAGVTRVKAYVFAGSSGGVNVSDGCNQGAQGAPGGAGVGIYTVTPLTSYAITVGLGGLLTAQETGTGASGGTSSFASVLTASGATAGTTSGGGVTTNGTSGTSSGGNLRNGQNCHTVTFPGAYTVGYINGNLGTGVGSFSTWSYPSQFYTVNTSHVWTIDSPINPGMCPGTDPSGQQRKSVGVSGAILLEYVA
jgi:hypothetical protein